MSNKQAIEKIHSDSLLDHTIAENRGKQLSIDIVTVTCNDQKWFPAYLESLIAQKGISHSKINLVVVDNNSDPSNFQVLLDCEKRGKEKLGSFQILRQNENLGFAKACNVGAKNTSGDLVFFLNIDTELEPGALSKFYEALASSGKEFGAWEFRQFPYEHPKIYNPITGEISWASGAALMVKRPIFEKLNGFDTSFYMYNDDVDISWRINLEGYKIKYLPECVVYHYSYQSFNESKPLQYYYSLFNNLQLRFKYGTTQEIKEGVRLLKNVFKQRGPFENSRKKLLKLIIKSSPRLIKQRMWYWKNKKNIREKNPYKFLGFDYELRREGDFFYNEFPTTSPLISVIVRTVNRPQVLRETLISLRKQTYKNLEIVIVEDGPPLSDQFIKSEFGDLNIRYYSMGKKSGRTKAGNLGLKMASGVYFNFLDDDDLLYADHFESLVRQTERQPRFKLFHNFAFEAKTTTVSKIPYKYRFDSLYTPHKKRFNLMRLCLYNFLPIQTVMFHRDVYETLGGFDESLDVLEDWDLWIRYATQFEFYTLSKTSSLYKVPTEPHLEHTRKALFDIAHKYVQKKQSEYTIKLNPVKLFELHKNIDK